MVSQLSILDVISSEANKQAGMSKAMNGVDPFWKDKALVALKEFLYNQDSGYKFRVEEFREWATQHNKVTVPHSKRAYGPVIKKAEKLSLVEFAGNSRVTNPDANRCFCSVWAKI